MSTIPPDPNLSADFVAECDELLAQLESDLGALAGPRADGATVHRAFRAAHTIKGSASFLGLAPIAELTHAIEGALGRARAGSPPEPGQADLLLRAVDALRVNLSELARGINLSDPPAGLALALLATNRPLESGARPAPAPNALATGVDRATVRVEIADLDALSRLARGLAAEIHRLGVNLGPGAFSMPRWFAPLEDSAARIAGIGAEIHRTIVRARTQPVGRLFAHGPHLVRDLARRTGKQLHLVVGACAFHVDRAVVDRLRDPVTHLLRNCAVHGIESPEERILAGKPAVGTIGLSASVEGARLRVDCTDDGRGVDRAGILRRATELGIGVRPGGPPLSDGEVLGLLFLPGFTGTDRVTELAGRGVGLDVVRAHVEGLRGTISAASVPGQGSRFTIHVPLSSPITSSRTDAARPPQE